MDPEDSLTDSRELSPLPARLLHSVIVPAVVFLAGLASFIENRFALSDFPLDDAWIHRVYSRSIALGQGFAYNPGRQEAGSSSPLWAIITAPAHWFEWLGTDTVTLLVKLTGVVLGLLCVMLVWRIAARLTGSGLAAALAASFFALEPRLLFSALSGMETLLLSAVLLGACVALMERRHVGYLVLMGLAPVVRPEAAALLPLCLLGIPAVWASGRKLWQKVVVTLIPLVPSALWVAFCLSVTGRPLPNTYYIKSRPFSLGFGDVMTGLQATFLHGLMPGIVIAVGICALAWFALRKRRRTEGLKALTLLVLAPSIYLLVVAGSRGISLNGFYWTRWIDPAALLTVAAATIGVAMVLVAAYHDFAQLSSRTLPRSSGMRRVAGVVMAMAVLVSVPHLMASFQDRRHHLASDARAIHAMNVAAGEWIAQNTPPNAIVAVNDAGAIRYFGNRYTVDLLGLNDADLAFGKESVEEAFGEADWVAVFPAWFDPALLAGFDARHEITIPLAEYTVAPAPDQTDEVIYQAHAGAPSAHL